MQAHLFFFLMLYAVHTLGEMPLRSEPQVFPFRILVEPFEIVLVSNTWWEIVLAFYVDFKLL
jgi:hypothetical protein